MTDWLDITDFISHTPGITGDPVSFMKITVMRIPSMLT